MAEPQLIVFISPDVNYALCVFFSGIHRILQMFVRKYVRSTQGCAVLAGFEKRDDESKRQGGPSLHNRSTPMQRLPILSPPQSYGTWGHKDTQNYWEWSLKEWLYFKQQRFVSSAARILHISQSYQGMAINITTGARDDRLGPGASQIGSQFPPQTKTNIFSTTFLKVASVKTADRTLHLLSYESFCDECLICGWREGTNE